MKHSRSRHVSPLGRAVRAVLTHPLAMALKAPLKDALWTARPEADEYLQSRSAFIPLLSCAKETCRSATAAAERLACSPLRTRQ